MGWVVFRIAFLYLSLILLVVPGCAATALQKETGEISRQVSNVDSQDQLTVNERYWLSMNLAHEKCKQYVWKDGDSRLFYPADESPEKYPKLYFSCMVENKIASSSGSLSDTDKRLIQIIEGNYPASWNTFSWGEIAHQKYGIDRFSPVNISITPDQFKNRDGLIDLGILKQKCTEVETGNSFIEMMILADHSSRFSQYECLSGGRSFYRFMYRYCPNRELKPMCVGGNLLYTSSLFLRKRIREIAEARVKRGQAHE